jgi:hypothetical protein
LERVTGIEPALSAWEADVLPLNYTRGARLRPAPGLADMVPEPPAGQQAPALTPHLFRYGPAALP